MKNITKSQYVLDYLNQIIGPYKLLCQNTFPDKIEGKFFGVKCWIQTETVDTLSSKPTPLKSDKEIMYQPQPKEATYHKLHINT